MLTPLPYVLLLILTDMVLLPLLSVRKIYDYCVISVSVEML